MMIDRFRRFGDAVHERDRARKASEAKLTADRLAVELPFRGRGEAVADFFGTEERRHRPAIVTAGTEGDKAARRRYGFATFPDAIAFVNRVAEAAEAADHHPDILVHYREVTLVLWTHTQDGITHKDLALAAAIGGLVEDASGAKA